MVGFEYQGQSTNSIIGTPLLLVSYDSMDGLGMTRSKIEGERTVSRFITNEYGTMYEPLSFTYALIKSDFEPFTEYEQRLVERWLTSPKLSSELRITNCEQYSYSYLGLFTSTRWEVGNGGFAICVFTFTVNGAYPYVNNIVERMHAELPLEENGQLTYAFEDMAFWCETDETEEYVYPVIRAKAIDINTNANSSFTMTFVTDNDEKFAVTTNSRETVVIDCRHCRAYLASPDGTEIRALSFRDLGWEDVDNVYWPRLRPGYNYIKVVGDVELSISYSMPYKKVGGWLI